jgi:RNA polymerase-binding transcription factor DksA
MTRSHDLTPAQLRDLEAELRYDLARLERTIASESASESASSVDAFSIDAEIAAHERGGVAVVLEGRARTRRAEVMEALDRIANGDYGTCTRCRTGIPYGRLMVMPETAYCKSCGE